MERKQSFKKAQRLPTPKIDGDMQGYAQDVLKYGNRGMIPKAVRDAVWARAEGKCEECGGFGDFRGLVPHHRKPKGMGGSKRVETAEDLELLCGKCHSREHHIREG